MSITLMPHQVEGFDWLRAMPLNEKGRILAFQPGLGKTLTALAAAFSYQYQGEHKPILVVCPAYLLHNWRAEIDRLTNRKAIVALCEGTTQRRNDTLRQHADIYLVNWEMLSYVDKFTRLLDTQWGTVILDECHKMRGRNSKCTKAAYQLSYARCYMLSGTPIVRDGGDVYPLLHMCTPRFNSYWRFVREWCHTVPNRWSGAYDVGDIKDPDAFRAMLTHFMSYKSYRQVGIPMPDAVEKEVLCDVSAQTYAEIVSITHDYRIHHPDGSTTNIAAMVQAITEVRKRTGSDPQKLATTKAIVDDFDDEPVLVWCWFKESARRLHKLLDAQQKRGVFMVNGDMSVEERDAVVEKWKSLPDAVLVATLASLGEGANLQHSSVTVFHEEDYLPKTQEQAIARQRRIGQQGVVRAFHVRARRTLDRKIASVFKNRQDNFEQVLLEELERITKLGEDDDEAA